MLVHALSQGELDGRVDRWLGVHCVASDWLGEGLHRDMGCGLCLGGGLGGLDQGGEGGTEVVVVGLGRVGAETGDLAVVVEYGQGA